MPACAECVRSFSTQTGAETARRIPEEDPRGLSESERRGEEPCQRIGESPARVTEGEMSRINVRALLACAVCCEQLVPANAENALGYSRQHRVLQS